MSRFSSFVGMPGLVVLCALLTIGSGCASTNVTEINRLRPEAVTRPDRVLVYPIATTMDELPSDSVLQAKASPREEKQSAEEMQLGRELGAQIAKELVTRLRDLGLPAVQATPGGSQERMNDLVIRGGFVEIDKGNMALRTMVGFGAGGSDLQTHFEVYAVTANGRTQMGTAGIKAAGGHMPGVLLSMGVGGVAKGAAVGGTLAAGREFTSESIQGAAERTAKEFIKTVKPDLERRGWISEQ